MVLFISYLPLLLFCIQLDCTWYTATPNVLILLFTFALACFVKSPTCFFVPHLIPFRLCSEPLTSLSCFYFASFFPSCPMYLHTTIRLPFAWPCVSLLGRFLYEFLIRFKFCNRLLILWGYLLTLLYASSYLPAFCFEAFMIIVLLATS